MILYQRKYTKDMGGGMARSATFTVSLHGFTNLFMIGAEMPLGWKERLVNLYIGPFRVEFDWR